MLRGFDASSVQGKIPWKALPDQGLRFAILKAQQGNDGFDPAFVDNVDGALSVGIEPLPYCFAYPLPHINPLDAAATFVHAVEHAHPAMIGRPIFLDCEWPAPEHWAAWKCDAEQVNAWFQACAFELEALSRTPVLYTYPWFWKAVSAADTSWAAHYPLWIASYTNKPVWPGEWEAPTIPRPWTDWLFWQFDGNGGLRLPNGVDADFNVYKGDEADLEALIHGAT